MNQNKMNELINWMEERVIDVTYISNPNSIAYFSGFKSDPHERVLALFLPRNAEPFLFTPALEVTSAKESGWPYDVVGYLDTENPWEKIATELQRRFGSFRKLGLEKSSLTVDRFECLANYLPSVNFQEDVTPCIQQLQLRKTPDEITTLLEAGSWADVAFEIGFNAIKSGISEQEIVAEIEYQLKRKGITQMSFDTTVLFGSHAASPHGVPNQTKLVENELVLFDLGVIWNGYCSDATRTVSFKEPTEYQQDIYNIVLEAQLAAQAAVRPGVTAESLDKIARDVIEGYGYAEAFNHRLGHGIGTSVHEFPSIVANNELIVEEGMCFSIEPGIYLPNNVGVRIEDCVYVTKNGCEPFTKTSKALQVID